MEKFNASIDDANKALEAQQNLEKALISVQKARLDAAVKTGAVDPGAEMEANNNIIQQNIVLEQQKLYYINKEIADREALKQKQIDSENKIRNANGETALTQDEINKAYTETDRDIVKLKTDAEKTTASIITLGASIETYGQKIQKNFTDGLTQGLTDIITHAKSAQAALLDMAKSWEK